MELDGQVLVIKRILVHYTLRASEDQRELVERVHQVHAENCPVARSFKGAIEVRTTFDLVPEQTGP